MHQNKLSSLKILAIDTSECYICIGLRLHGRFVFTSRESHSHHDILTTTLREIIESYDNFDVADIDLLVCTNGPGTYIGTRVGIAMTKGLAATANIPYILVSTLTPYYVQNYPAVVLAKKSKNYSIIQIHYTKNTRGDLLQCSYTQLSTIVNTLSKFRASGNVSLYYRNNQIRHAVQSQNIIELDGTYTWYVYAEQQYMMNLMECGAQRFITHLSTPEDKDAVYINDGHHT